MRGRFAGFGPLGMIVFSAGLFFVPLTAAVAQELSDDLVLMIEERALEGGGDMESLVSYYEHLMEHPLDINRSEASELEYLGLLSDFQIASLLDYREEFGEILSEAELELVDGFNIRTVKMIRPFILFRKTRDVAALPGRYVRQEARIRSRRKIPERTPLGIPYYFGLRYRFRYGKLLEAGFTAENDAGEPHYPDFLSVRLALQHLPVFGNVAVRSLVLGDFSARFGQGLVLWNSFSMSSMGNPSSVFRKESPVVPYASTDESRFFRGLGASLDLGRRFRLSLLASRKRVDARIDGEHYISLPSDGLHNTVSRMASRRKMGETLYGCNLSYRGERFKFGLTAAAYAFDRRNGIKLRKDNRLQQYDGWWGNCSLDFNVLPGTGWRFFGEMAADLRGAPAVLLGLIYSPDGAAEYAVLPRYYSERYIARHAGGYSTSSRCANECGLLLSGRWNPAEDFSFALSGDLVYYPGLRYGADAPFFAVKARGESGYEFHAGHRLSTRISFQYKGDDRLCKGGVRLHYTASAGRGVSLAARLESSASVTPSRPLTAGALAYLEGMYTAESASFSLSLRSSFFHVDHWEDRIYCYERDLPRSFAVPARYGRGLSFYVNLKYEPWEWARLYFKASYTDFFNRPEDVFHLKMELNLTF